MTAEQPDRGSREMLDTPDTTGVLCRVYYHLAAGAMRTIYNKRKKTVRGRYVSEAVHDTNMNKM